jgi:hypothetical protein
MLPLGGLHSKHAVQRGIWVPTQHFLWDQGTPLKTLIDLAGRRTFRMLAVRHFFFHSFFFFLTSCFLQLFLCAYVLDKHQTVYNTCGRNERIYEEICIQIYIRIRICDSLIIGKFVSQL